MDKTQSNNNFKNKKIGSKPTIAHVVSYYPPNIGGMEINTQEVSLKLAQRNWPVYVITSNLGAVDAPAVEKSDNYVVNRLKATQLPHVPVIWGLFGKLFSLPKKSVIHLHVSHVIIPEAVWLVSKTRRIPYIAHFHIDVSVTLKGVKSFLFKIYRKVFLGPVMRNASKVLVYSQQQSDVVKKLYLVDPSKITIIPNGVAERFFKFKPRALPQDALKLLYVGRLCVQKRVDRLLESIAITKAPVKLTIVGDGKEHNSLNMQVKRLGLDNVNFVGSKTGNDLLRYFQDADVFVLPSDVEAGMPQVILQSMANGLPVIGADVLGVSEFIDKSGILASPTPEGFAKAFEKIWQDKQQLKSLSRLGSNKAKNYSWRNLTKKLEPLYESVFDECWEDTSEVGT